MDTRGLSFANPDETASHEWAEVYPNKDWILYHLNLERFLKHLRKDLPQADGSVEFRYLTRREFDHLDKKLVDEMKAVFDDAPKQHHINSCKECHQEFKQVIEGVVANEAWQKDELSKPNDFNLMLDSLREHHDVINERYLEHERAREAFRLKEKYLKEGMPAGEEFVLIEGADETSEIPDTLSDDDFIELNQHGRMINPPTQDQESFFDYYTNNFPWSWAFVKFIIIPCALAAILVFSGGTAAMGMALEELVSFLLVAAGLSIVGNLFLEVGKSIYNYFAASKPNADDGEPQPKDLNLNETEQDKELRKDKEELAHLFQGILDKIEQDKHSQEAEPTIKAESTTLKDSPSSKKLSIKTENSDTEISPNFTVDENGQIFFSTDETSAASTPLSSPSPISELSGSLKTPNNSPDTQPSSLRASINEADISSMSAPKPTRSSMTIVPTAAELVKGLSKVLSQLNDQENTESKTHSRENSDPHYSVHEEMLEETQPLPVKLSQGGDNETSTIEVDSSAAAKPPVISAPLVTSLDSQSQEQRLSGLQFRRHSQNASRAANLKVFSTKIEATISKERKAIQEQLAARAKTRAPVDEVRSAGLALNERIKAAAASEEKINVLQEKSKVYGVSEDALKSVISYLANWKTRTSEERQSVLAPYKEAVQAKKAFLAEIEAKKTEPSAAGSNDILVRKLSSPGAITSAIIGNLAKANTSSIITDTLPFPDEQNQVAPAAVGSSSPLSTSTLSDTVESLDAGKDQVMQDDQDKKEVKRNFV